MEDNPYTEDNLCPGCGEPWEMATTGSNRHFYRTYNCSNEHEWAVPMAQHEIDYWMSVNKRAPVRQDLT